MAFLFLLLFSYLKEPEENKRQHFILRRNVCHLLFEGKKCHMGKLDIISVSGLNRCGTGRIERFFWGCWKTSSQEWEVVRNYLPVFYILALPCFFLFLFFSEKTVTWKEAWSEVPETFYSPALKLLQEPNGSVFNYCSWKCCCRGLGKLILANRRKQPARQENKQSGWCVVNSVLYAKSTFYFLF